MTHRKKLIEVALPLEAINKASAREKSIRHGHPSTFHLWWARRPLAACRAGADAVTVTRDEILAAINSPDQYILAIVEVENGQAREPRYVRKPFKKEPDFGVTSVNYNLGQLLVMNETPS